MKHLDIAHAYFQGLIHFLQKNNLEIQLQVSQYIPKQIQEMKASVMKTFDELEQLLLRETRKIAYIKLSDGNVEIAKWLSHIETVNEAATLLSVAQENGSDVHKFIASKNVKKQLADVDRTIGQSRGQLQSRSLSFSFDKGTLLRNAHVGLNNVNKSLAEIDSPGIQQKQQQSASKYTTGYGPGTTFNPFAKFSVVTKQVETPIYSYGQLALHKQRSFYDD